MSALGFESAHTQAFGYCSYGGSLIIDGIYVIERFVVMGLGWRIRVLPSIILF